MHHANSPLFSFFNEHVSGRFPLSSYAFDVVRRAKDTVDLVDFNPFGPPATDAVLFQWDELRDNEVVGGEDQLPGQFLRNSLVLPIFKYFSCVA